MIEQLVTKYSLIGDGFKKIQEVGKRVQALKDRASVEMRANVQDNASRVLQRIQRTVSNTKSLFHSPFLLKVRNTTTGAFQSVSRTFQKMKQKLQSTILFKGMVRGISLAKPHLKRFGDYAVQQFEKAQAKASTMGGIFKRILGTLAAGFTLKTGIEGAANLEKYRNTLETVLKDPNAARQKLAWGSRFANRTPFETEEVVGGMTKLQSYGIEGDRVLNTTKRTYLEMIGDMAAGMGKSFDQAIEAVADAKTGELERLKEFGITKNMLAEFGKKQGLTLFNNKGQIEDMDLFNKTLFEMMNSRFGGAMQKQARTFKGAISTIQGGLKSGLATLMGTNEFGDVIENSPFQILRDKVLIPFSDYLVKMQESGAFTKIAENIGKNIERLITIGEKAISFMAKWKEVLIPLAGAILGLLVIHKVIVAIGAMKKAIGLITSGFNPWMLVMGAVIALGILLYRNWDTIKEKMMSLWEKVKSFGLAIWEFGKKIFFLCSPFGLLIRVGKMLIQNWDTIKAKFSQIGSFLLNKITGIWESLKSATSSAFDFVLGYVEIVWEKIKGFFRGLGEKIKSIPGISVFFKEKGIDEGSNPGIDGSHAKGLDYVPFDGYIAELHEGERVLTKEENQNFSEVDRSIQTTSNHSWKNSQKLQVNNYFTITANKEQDWKKVGEIVREEIERREEEHEIMRGEI